MPSPRRPGRAFLRGNLTLIAALTCAIAVLAGCTSAASGSGSPPPMVPAGAQAPPSRLDWHPCAVGRTRLQCASLAVPLDYRHPAGRKITLALSMAPATAPADQRQGDLLVDPGGPGASGRYLAAQTADLLHHTVASEYNIIGFDPRGVGASVPALRCDPSFFAGVRPDYIPASRAAEQVLIARARAYAADCERRFGWLLPFMTTQDAARDMDSIRVAFGVAKINYYAYSWGTYLGQVYATLFPARVRRMVLDSTVDPTRVWYTDNIDQDYAFQARMDAFFAWVARYDGTYQLGRTATQVRDAYYRARNQLLTAPAGRIVGPDELDATFVTGGYIDGIWPGLAQA